VWWWAQERATKSFSPEFGKKLVFPLWLPLVEECGGCLFFKRGSWSRQSKISSSTVKCQLYDYACLYFRCFTREESRERTQKRFPTDIIVYSINNNNNSSPFICSVLCRGSDKNFYLPVDQFLWRRINKKGTNGN
jgi:hypothetical protein